VYSAPFSVQVTNPVQLISIVQQPSGSVNTAVALPVQPRLLITSVGPSIVGQQVQASADPSCTPGATLLYSTCTVLPDSTCEFYNLAVVGIFKEVAAPCAPCLFAVAFFFCLFAVTFFLLALQGELPVCFRFSIFGVTSQVSQPVYVRAASALAIRSVLNVFLQITNPNVPKTSELKNWQRITWSVVLIFFPISALNNVDSGALVWFAGLASFLYFCSVLM